MVDSAGSLSFGFDADFSGFTRAADGAGQTLDRLSRTAAQWAGSTSNDLSRTLGGAAALQSAQSGALETAARAMTGKARIAATAIAAPNGLSAGQLLAGLTIKDTSGDKDDNSAKVLTHLSEQLALLQSTGAAHDKIAERIKIEAEQAKLGSDATVAEKNAVAGLVQQIDAATAAQTKLKAAQEATNKAWTFGSQQALNGIDAMIFGGARLGDAAAGMLRNLAKAGLGAALTGSGPFAGLFGTQGSKGAEGGLFGAVGKALLGGGTPSVNGGALSSGTITSSFAGLFADGGSIGAGEWGIVGEQGAEVVAGPAAVTPWDKISPATGAPRSTQVINFNVTSPDAPSFARSETQMAALLSRAVMRGQRNI